MLGEDGRVPGVGAALGLLCPGLGQGFFLHPPHPEAGAELGFWSMVLLSG